MIAIDTNILTSVRSPVPSANRVAIASLAKFSAQGPMCVCGAVFAELLGLPATDLPTLRSMFVQFAIAIDWRLDQSDWETAGLAYQEYVVRRRSSGGGLPRLMLTDFIIGAHASVRGYSLLTLDGRLYRAAFPNLRIETP